MNLIDFKKVPRNATSYRNYCSFFWFNFLGTFLKSIKFLNEEKTTFLSRFAFYVLMPVMLFSNISKTSFNGNFDFKFIIKYEFVTILIIFLFVCLGLSLKKSLPRSTIIGLNAVILIMAT